MYYIGLDVHKKTISYCVKDASGQVHQEGQIGATRWELDGWMKTLPQPWTVAMEATIFTGQVLRLPTERRRSNSRGSLRIVSGLAENTHSIFCDGPHGPETVNGCPVLRRQEPPPRGTRASCGF